MKLSISLPIAALAVCIAGLAFAACCGKNASEENTMKPSVTYLHLLRHTPFFTRLDTPQLRWTIAHSQEWEAQAGTVIVDCHAEPRDDAIWILLDGRWQLEENGRLHPAGHADPGKWFSTTAARGPCRLVATEHSYVMKIMRVDTDEMLAHGFAFHAHLQEGESYYSAIFARQPGVE